MIPTIKIRNTSYVFYIKYLLTLCGVVNGDAMEFDELLIFQFLSITSQKITIKMETFLNK